VEFSARRTRHHGVNLGIAVAGGKPVAEIQFCDYIFNTIDLLKLVGNAHWGSAGEFHLPLVVMTPVGAGIGSIYRSHSFDSIMTHIPGWKIVMPSTPIDAYGLMIAALKDTNPVMFMKPKALLRTKGDGRIPGEPEDEKVLKDMIDAPLGDRSNWKPRWPDLTDYTRANRQRSSAKARTSPASPTDVTSTGRRTAAETLANDGISVELIDLRTLFPYDFEAIKASVAERDAWSS
jgi:2-oxoisovalerate dehydrogenase E1 component beta subunit